MSMLQEFREFAVKGNAMDLAVGVIIGGAFGKIVESVVGDLIMPLVSRVTGRLDFSNLYVLLGDNPNKLTALADIKTAGIPYRVPQAEDLPARLAGVRVLSVKLSVFALAGVIAAVAGIIFTGQASTGVPLRAPMSIPAWKPPLRQP